MPRATDSRKAIGTETCTKCGEQAEFYQVQRGKKVGHLYRKGCECKAIQNTPPFQQLEWLERMTRTPHPMIPNPYTGAGASELAEGPEPKPKSENPPEPVASSEGEPESKRGVILGGLILVSGIAAALLT
jgi:hypothetical protein